jgi:hypothetical protein
MALEYDSAEVGIRLRIFTGKPSDDWTDWSDRFRAKASRRDLEHRLGTTRPTDDEAAGTAWDKDSKKIYYLLIEYTGGAASGIVKQHRTTTNGIAAWQALVDKYELKGFVQEADLHAQWHRETLSATEDPDAFFTRLEKPVARLRELGVDITDRMLVGQIMARMPANYLPLRTLLDTMEDELEYEYLKSKMRCFYVRNIAAKESGSGANDQALTTGFSGACFACGERGHTKANCPKRSQSNGGRGGGRGGGRMGRGGRGGRGRGNSGSKLVCWTCGKAGHKSTECRSNDGAANVADEDAMALIANKGEYALMSESAYVQAFKVDSGASSTMMQSGEDLTNVRPMEGHVSMANGAKVKTVAVGDLEAAVRLENGLMKYVTIKDVLVVPELSYNLLSVDKVVDRGGKVWFGKNTSGNQIGMIEMGNKRIPLRRNKALYELVVRPRIGKRAGTACNAEELACGAAELWHDRLGHRNAEDMRTYESWMWACPRACDSMASARCVRSVSIPMQASIAQLITRSSRRASCSSWTCWARWRRRAWVDIAMPSCSPAPRPSGARST